MAGVFAGRSRTNLVKVAVPTVPPQDTALLALTSSALVIIVLVLLALSIIYCKRFWKSQCQRGESMPAVLLPLLPLPFTRARSRSLLRKGPLLCFACSKTRGASLRGPTVRSGTLPFHCHSCSPLSAGFLGPAEVGWLCMGQDG